MHAKCHIVEFKPYIYNAEIDYVPELIIYEC